MIQVAQELEGFAVGSVSSFTLTFANPVYANSAIHVIVASFSATTTLGCSDNLNGTYGSALDTQIAGGQTNAHFQFSGSAAGTLTVTITSTVSTGIGVWMREIQGTTGYDSNGGLGHHALTQVNPGTATDGVGSGNCTPSVQPGLLSGVAMEVVGSAGYTAGTGYTQGLYNHNTMTESRRYTSTALTAATFTDSNGATGTSISFAALFKEAAFSATAAGASGSVGTAQISVATGTITGTGASGSAGVALLQGQTLIGAGSGSFGVVNLYSATTGSIFFAQGPSGSLGVVSLTGSGALTAVGLSGSGALVNLSGVTYSLQATGVSGSQGIAALLSINPGAIQAIGASGSMGLLFLQTSPIPPPPPPPNGFWVEAVTAGYYGGVFRTPGDVFELATAGDFSDCTVNYQAASNGVGYGWMARTAQTEAYDWLTQNDAPYLPPQDSLRRTVY